MEKLPSARMVIEARKFISRCLAARATDTPVHRPTCERGTRLRVFTLCHSTRLLADQSPPHRRNVRKVGGDDTN